VEVSGLGLSPFTAGEAAYGSASGANPATPVLAYATTFSILFACNGAYSGALSTAIPHAGWTGGSVGNLEYSYKVESSARSDFCSWTNTGMSGGSCVIAALHP
jgi:hypothetical protein